MTAKQGKRTALARPAPASAVEIANVPIELQRYGDYERSAFDRTSHLYLWVAARAEEAG